MKLCFHVNDTKRGRARNAAMFLKRKRARAWRTPKTKVVSGGPMTGIWPHLKSVPAMERAAWLNGPRLSRVSE